MPSDPIWTEAKALTAVQEWTQAHGRPPRYDDWRLAAKPTEDIDRPTAQVVASIFGSFTRGINRAGVGTGVRRERNQAEINEAVDEAKARTANGESRSDLARDFGVAPDTISRWVHASQCQCGNWITKYHTTRCWRCSHPKHRRRIVASWPDEEITLACQQFYDTHGRWPTRADLSAGSRTGVNALPSATTVTRRYGSIQALHKAARKASLRSK